MNQFKSMIDESVSEIEAWLGYSPDGERYRRFMDRFLPELGRLKHFDSIDEFANHYKKLNRMFSDSGPIMSSDFPRTFDVIGVSLQKMRKL